MFAREGDDSAVGALAFDQIGADRLKILDGALDARCHHHRAGLAADLVQRQHLLVEMIDHDLDLAADRMVIALDIVPQFLGGALGVEFRVGVDGLDQPVIAVDRRVIAQHIEDEPFLDRLLHCVAVERDDA